MLIKRIPTRVYFITLFAVAALMLLGFSGLIYQHHENIQKVNDKIVSDYEFVRLSRRALTQALEMETGVRGYLLTANTRFLDPYSQTKKQAPEFLAALQRAAKTQDDKALVQKWNARVAEFEQRLDKLVKRPSASLNNDLWQMKQEMDELRAMFSQDIEPRVERLNHFLSIAQEERRLFTNILIIATALGVGGMLIATLIILALANRSSKAENEAREASERILLIMNGIDDGVFDFKPQSNEIHISSAFKEMLGYKEDELPSTLEAVNAAIHPDDSKEAWENFYRYARKEIPSYVSRFRMQHKDGSWRWILSRGVGFWDDKGNITRLLGTHTDITDHKNSEDELKHLNSELESFTYIASHDLRSPLVNLKGFAQEMELAVARIRPVLSNVIPTLPHAQAVDIKQSLDVDIPEALNFIGKSVEKMDTLITAVLDFSRIGRHRFKNEVVDVSAIVKKCLETLAYEINQNNVEVLCGKLPDVVADPLAVEQVFSNLIENAVKYLEPNRRGKIVITATESARDVVFCIEDNGRGIADQDKEKIFEIFRRARNTGDVRGLGMGMAFVKATLRKLGGSVWFTSREGEGTTFYVRLSKTPRAHA